MHLDYPKTEEENLKWRTELLSQCEEKETISGRQRYTRKAEELQGKLLDLAMTDVLFYFNTFLWTYDPRPDRGAPDKPFCTYPKQDEFILWLEDLYKTPHAVSGFTDKPRDMGFTYCTIGTYTWRWLGEDGYNAHVGSRKEDLVEKKGATDTLMFKADYMIRNLPKWMLPGGFNIDRDHTFGCIKRPDNNNTITGESANPDFGRGGRYSDTLLDEYGFWEWAKSAWESCGESSHCRLAGTTPPQSGKSSHAWKLLSGQAGKVSVFTFDYLDVPWKDDDWIRLAREGKSSMEFQREVLRSYDSSSEDKVYAKEWNTYVRRDTCLTYNPHLPLFVSWDYGYDGTGLIWWQKDFRTNWNYAIRSYWKENLDIDFFVPFVNGGIIAPEHDYQPWELELIRQSSKWKISAHFGDPDVKKRSMVQRINLKDYLANNHHIGINTHSWTQEYTHYNIRENMKVFFKRLTINPVTCSSLEDSMNNAHYPRRKEESESTATDKKPVHDWTSHLRSSSEYYMINEPHESPESTRDEHPAGTEHDAEEEAIVDDFGFASLSH